MTTIRATCPTCGEVDLSPEDIFLSVREPASTYRFVCPLCAQAIQKRADRKVVALLLSAGVNLGDGRPAEPTIRAENAELPVFTREDVRSFAELLRGNDFLYQLVEGA